MSGEMRIWTWTARNWSDYEMRVQPKIHALLSSLGGNSMYAELSIAEVLRGLIGMRDAEVLIRAVLIEHDLRFILRSERGEKMRRSTLFYGRALRKCSRSIEISGGFLPLSNLPVWI